MTLRICYFTTTGLELGCLGQAVLSASKKGLKLKVTARTGQQLQQKEQADEAIKQAQLSHVVIVNLHGGKDSCPIFDRLMEALKGLSRQSRPYLHIEPTQGDEDSQEVARLHSPDFGKSAWRQIHQYIMYGGTRNFEALLAFLARLRGMEGFSPAPPQKVVTEAIYHPDMAGSPELNEYLQKKVKKGKPTLGLWFYQTHWLNGNLDFIDAIIHEIEARGANVIPVFHQRFKDSELHNLDARQVAERFFKEGAKSRIDVLINPVFFSLKMAGSLYHGLLEGLDVPVLQAMVSLGDFKSWKESQQGLTFLDVSYNAAQPEMDGNLITVPVATREILENDPITGAQIIRYVPIPERVRKFVDLALNWARLRHIPNREKRIAIIFHHYPPRDDRIGCAAGLDSFSSVKELLSEMKEQGYTVRETFQSGDDLAKRLLSGLTPDTRWFEADMLSQKAEASLSLDTYKEYFHALTPKVKSEMETAWGKPPGNHMCHLGNLYLPGFLNGNIFITIQPSRGNIEKIKEQYHDPHLPPPHSYIGHYHWIRHVFKADAVIHVGKHGTLEWLPGKSLGLSQDCYPDIAISDLPNIYPYIINDPSEGTQAKRRSYACIIDHLTPAYTNADLYDELAQIEHLLQEYAHATEEDPAKAETMRPMILDAVKKANLHDDLAIDPEIPPSDFHGFIQRLHSYLLELSDTMIADGLHILGKRPEGPKLVEFLVQLTRLENLNVPSLRAVCIRALGHSPEKVRDNLKKEPADSHFLSSRQIIKKAHKLALAVVKELQRQDFNPDFVPEIIKKYLSHSQDEAQEVLSYICDRLVPTLENTKQEISSCLRALSGRFVPPGPSGSPTRGQAHILPTGRNFYSVDPLKIPSPAAWKQGVEMGKALIQRYLKEKGKYPASIGIVVYGGPTMRTRGEDVAEILWLMGVRPKWHQGSWRVTNLEVIPLERLGRPRLDVVVRVSGFFRDAFPNLMELLDKAACMVAALKEAPSDNILRKNVLQDLTQHMKQGISQEEAWRLSTLRVFGCPPGTYGAGVAELVESKQWKSRNDLAEAYIHYSSHAYGKGVRGEKKAETFKRLLSRMELTVKNEDSREYDMMSCTDYFNYYGGLIAAAEREMGHLPESYMGDSADPEVPQIRSTKEEAMHILRARLVNPKWLKGMMEHGYKGAGEISHVMDIVFGWDATAGVVEEWMYQKLAHTYCLDRKLREWMKRVNPAALYNITDKLLEAISRGMWNADPDTQSRLRDLYLEMEGEIEEIKE